MVHPKNIVVKISGKWINPDRPEIIGGYARVLKKLYEEGYRIAVVVGGGRVAREYITAGRKLGLSEAMLDLMGIAATRLNAMLFTVILNDLAYQGVPRSLDEFMEAWSTGKIVICGGFQPGQSTNAVSALIAEAIGAKLLVNATTVQGLYDKDPNKYPDARLIKEASVEETYRILIGEQHYAAGGYELMDPLSLMIIKRGGITVKIVYGGNPENVYRAVKGENPGTTIKPE